jgi:hypothetical protein
MLKSGAPGEIAKIFVLEKSWKNFVETGMIIAGSPSTVADRLTEAIKTLRFGNLIGLMQVGSMSHELTKQNLTLFAEGVIPKIRQLWAEDGYEHHWWPSGVKQPAATIIMS